MTCDENVELCIHWSSHMFHHHAVRGSSPQEHVHMAQWSLGFHELSWLFLLLWCVHFSCQCQSTCPLTICKLCGRSTQPFQRNQDPKIHRYFPQHPSIYFLLLTSASGICCSLSGMVREPRAEQLVWISFPVVKHPLSAKPPAFWPTLSSFTRLLAIVYKKYLTIFRF